MKKTIAAIVVVVAACSPGETGESSTTSSTSVLGSTTTSGAVTTTAVPGTTTTTGATTTTTLGTTTTSPLLEGNWADEPLVTTDFGALGWWDGSSWLDAETEGALPVVGGEDYQVTVLGSLGMTTAGPQAIVCDPLQLLGVMIDDPDLLGDFPGPYGVAISAPWQLVPHLVEVASDDATYADFAAALLSERGLDVANPVIKQLIRTDLEGDGVNEVIVVAEEVNPSFLMEIGDYSILFLRKVVEGDVQTAVLEETVVLSEDDQFSGSHIVGTIADLNGDSKMEIVTNSAYFEGFGVNVWEYVNDDIGPSIALQTGCGS
ncbi:MAG TPA: hypothetical protein VFS66_15350 [Acidimicrobiia bacterium]|nr:hypothetical protein [Acidimicrobiia bacterium]